MEYSLKAGDKVRISPNSNSYAYFKGLGIKGLDEEFAVQDIRAGGTIAQIGVFYKNGQYTTLFIEEKELCKV